MIKRLITLVKHWREAKTAFSTLSYLYSDGNISLDVLGYIPTATYRWMYWEA